MNCPYPEDIRNIPDVLKWFSKELEKSTGTGLSSSQYPMLGGRIKNFMQKNDLNIEDFTLLLWGVMNEKSKIYSPAYSFYFLENLEDYREMKKKSKERKKGKEVKFNKNILDEENKGKEGDIFENL